MNKEEILNRLIQKSICINAGGKGCYSPYTNDMDWFSDIDNLILMYEQLQQENQKYKEVINKANKKLNNFIECCKAEKLESGSDYIHHQYWDMFERFNKQIKDILKEVSNNE